MSNARACRWSGDLLDLHDYDENDINGNKKIQVAVNGEEAWVEGETTCVIRRGEA